MDILIIFIVIILSTSFLYLLATHLKLDKGYWLTYGLLYGPIAIPFLWFSRNKTTPTEFNELVKYNDYKSATIFAASLSQLGLYIFLPILWKYFVLESRGGGNVHPFEIMFWLSVLGIPSFIAYVSAIIGLIISTYALLKYKKLNILILHTAIVFIFIQICFLNW